MKIYRLAFLALALFNSFSAFSQDLSGINYLQYNKKDITLEKDLIFPKDIAIGNKNAPVTIVEYSSFSCVHCAELSKNVMKDLKSKYIDSGKVLLILRDFPLDKASLTASTLFSCYNSNFYCANCSKKSPREPIKFSTEIFESRDNWNATNALDLIKSVAMKNGMSDKEIEKCLSDEALQNKIVHSKIIGIKYLKINAVPTLFINGKNYEGKHTSKDIEEYIDGILNTNNTQ